MVCSRVVDAPAAGRAWSGVVLTHHCENDVTKAVICGIGQTVTITSPLAVPGKFSCYGLLPDETDASTLHLTAESRCFSCDPKHGNDVVVELCAGIGGIGLGASWAGFKVGPQVDFNALAHEHLRAAGAPFPILGDIADLQVLKHIQEVLEGPPALVAAGFNCQPFSYQGDQRGLRDPRAKSFWATLQATYFLQPRALLLECTPGAGGDLEVQQILREFQSLMGWQMQELTFDLAAQWPCRRLRWWAILFDVNLASRPLLSWPTDPDFQRLEQVIQEWPQWPWVDEHQLLLNDMEKEAFLWTYMDANRMMDMMGPASTFLHSYANAMTACPCGCRDAAFNECRLAKGGLRGSLVLTIDLQPRFLHPKEVMFLLSFPGTFPIRLDLRATLCMLGQSAAPLQAFWVAHHLRCTLTGLWTSDALKIIQSHKSQLRFEKYHTWPISDTLASIEIAFDTPEGSTICFIKNGAVTAAEALAALRSGAEWGERWVLMDGSLRVPLDALLRTSGYYGQYVLHRLVKRQALPKPEGPMVIQVTSADSSWVDFFQVGDFVFEIRNKLGLPDSCQLVSLDGLTLPLDLRLWDSQSLHLLDLSGAGSSTFSRGMHMDFVRAVAFCMLERLAMARHFRLAGVCLDFDPWLESFGHVLQQPPRAAEHMAISVLHRNHWILLPIFMTTDDCFSATVWDGLPDATISKTVERFVKHFASLWDLRCASLSFECIIRQTLPDSCGTILLGHLGLVLGFFDTSLSASLEAMHPSLMEICDTMEVDEELQLFGMGRHASSSSASTSLQSQLEDLLKEKGVPADKVEERASLALKKLGTKEIEEGLKSANPWAYLKAVASRPHHAFQWVKADELQNKIRAKASAKFAIQSNKPKGQGKNRKEPEQLYLDPELLQLVPGTFYAKEAEVKQISFAEIAPGATGLAFGTLADVLPYLKQGDFLSDDPLAVLTTAPIPSDQTGTLAVTNLRFPAQVSGTNEPVLIQGSIVQLGRTLVGRSKAPSACTLDCMPTQTLRLYVYRDQWNGSWQQFTEQPFRLLLQEIPFLNLCKQDKCGDTCPRFHAAVDEPLDNLVLDLWARSWHRGDARYTKPADAEYWSVLIRVPQSAQISLQSLSGQHGLYVEPRNDCGKMADERFGMIWLGELSLQELGHKLKTTPGALAIGRLKNKYGLRFWNADLEKGYKTLKPTEQFVDTKVQTLYKLFPLPFGLQRIALQKCITAWGWNAKVRQSIGGGQEGTAWEVGASEPPPSLILPADSGDVTITIIRAMAKPQEPPTLLATSTTRKFLKASKSVATGSADPWTSGPDPWGGWQPTTANVVQGPDKLKQLETRLKQSVDDAIKQRAEADESMGGNAPDPAFVAATEARFARLEVGVTELQAQGQKFEGWFNQMSQTEAAMANQVDSLSKQVEVQGHQIEQTRAELHTQVSGLRGEVAAVKSDVTNGFNRIEALLEKRARSS